MAHGTQLLCHLETPFHGLLQSYFFIYIILLRPRHRKPYRKVHNSQHEVKKKEKHFRPQTETVPPVLSPKNSLRVLRLKWCQKKYRGWHRHLKNRGSAVPPSSIFPEISPRWHKLFFCLILSCIGLT